MGTRRGSGRAPRVRQGARGWGDTCHIVGSSTSWSPSAHSCCSNSSNSSSSCGSRCAAVRGESAPNRRRAVEPLAVMGGRRPVPRDPMPRRRGLGCRRGGGVNRRRRGDGVRGGARASSRSRCCVVVLPFSALAAMPGRQTSYKKIFFPALKKRRPSPSSHPSLGLSVFFLFSAELGIGPPQAAWRGAVVHPSGGPSAPGRRCLRYVVGG